MNNLSRVLTLLRQADHQPVSGEQLSQQLGITRTAVWKHIKQLEANGYQIEALPHKGYRLLLSPDRLFPDEIQYQLNTAFIGKKIYAFKETTSTNDRAIDYAQNGAAAGSVIIAEYQTAGRGRRERQWWSAPNQNLLFSIIFRPDWPTSWVPRMMPMMVVSVARGIEAVIDRPVEIKWPNDLFIANKKIAGILTEMQGQADAVDYVIVGIGINVNGPSPKQTRYPAGSLSQMVGKPVNRLLVLKQILQQIEYFYQDLMENGMDRIMQEWKKRSLLTGSLVAIDQGQQCLEGMVLGLDDQGALLLRNEVGLVQPIYSGELVACQPVATTSDRDIAAR